MSRWNYLCERSLAGAFQEEGTASAEALRQNECSRISTEAIILEAERETEMIPGQNHLPGEVWALTWRYLGITPVGS